MTTRVTGSSLVKICMKFHLENQTTAYMKEINRIQTVTDLNPRDPWKTEFKRWERTTVINELTRMKSLVGVTKPSAWWKTAVYVDGSEESHLIANVRGGNAELGNRDNNMAAFDTRNVAGKTKICRLCHQNEWLSEIHVILSCPAMRETRNGCLYKNTSFTNWLTTELTSLTRVEVYQKLLQPNLPSRNDKQELADLLGTMLTEYKLKWLAHQT